MSVWPQAPRFQLSTAQGDLLQVRVAVEAFLLEDLLEVLAEANFPINPTIQHHAELVIDGRKQAGVCVEFPAWRSQLIEVQTLLNRGGFGGNLTTHNMLEEIQA